MIRNLKVLGLALCAVFAFSAVATSAASAQDKITGPAGTTFVTGIQEGPVSDNTWGTKDSALAVNCTGATYTGSFVEVAASIEVTPAFTGCTAFGAASPVDVNGCKFLLSGTTHNTVNTSGIPNGQEATINLNCSHTGSIKITGLGGCTITLEDTHTVGHPTVNQNLVGARYTNGQSPVGKWDIKADVTLDNIQYTSTAPCTAFNITHPTGSDFFLTTTVTFKGYSSASHSAASQVSITQS